MFVPTQESKNNELKKRELVRTILSLTSSSTKILHYAFVKNCLRNSTLKFVKKKQNCKKGKNAKKKQKGRKCTFDFKIDAKKPKMQKKGRNAKKGRKCMFHLKIHAKKDKHAFSISKFLQKSKSKKKHMYFIFFAFISPVYFFFILDLKIRAKQTKMRKKAKKKYAQKRQDVYHTWTITWRLITM